LELANDFMTDNYGFGYEKRRQGNLDMLNGTETFRDGFQKMVNSWTVSIPETISIVKKHIKLDPHFHDFARWAKINSVPIVVLSAGMAPIIRALLDEFLGELASNIEIVANDVQPIPPLNDPAEAGGFTIKYHDESDFGHDKSRTIRSYTASVATVADGKRGPILLYAGDGVSDVSAAKETDLLFAKAGRDLITYCEREGIPFTIFEDWASILKKTQEIFAGRVKTENVAEETLDQVAIES
jgi:2,3-diketo-5-methylthio-1-phosphopentane phosphatase